MPPRVSRSQRNASAKASKSTSAGLRRTNTKEKQEEVASKSGTEPTVATPTSTSDSADEWENLSQWNDASVAQVAEWWNLNQQQIDKLWQLHDRLQDITHWKNQPNEVVRYLRDAHGNIKNAEAKFRKMVQWRIDEDVDNIIYNYEPPHPLMEEYLPTTVLESCDKGGDPIWLERVGAADSWGLLKTFGQAQLIRYAVYIREVCIRGEWAKDYQRRRGRPPARATAIIDLGGMGWDHCRPGLLPLLKEGLQIIQDYYVGFGKKVIVIRCGKLFPAVWKVAQHFCGENLKNMLVFANSENYLEVLEEYVDLESLPPCIYPQGKGRGGVSMPNGLDGGKVPKWEELDQLLAERQTKEGVPDTVKDRDLLLTTSSLTDEDGRSVHSPRSVGSTVASAISPTSSLASGASPKDLQNAMDPHQWTDANYFRVMEYFRASKKEDAQIRDLQERLADIDHWKNSPLILMYFLRDCRHKVKVAEKRFRQMVQWRLDNNVDHILETYRPPKLILEHLSATMLRTDGCDYDGDPIYLERVGNADSWAMYQRFGKRGIVDYVTWLRETADRGEYAQLYEKQHGHPIMQTTVVVDLQGLSVRHMNPGLLPLFRNVTEVAQLHYCGVMKRAFVIRAPKIFKVIWNIVKHFMHDNVRDLIVFCSVDDYLDVMSQYMDINNLPPCIYEHGRGEGGLGMPKKLDAGRLPPPTDRDQDLATKDDIDPGYTASRKAIAAATACAKGARLGGGVFDFTFPDEDSETVVTLTS